MVVTVKITATVEINQLSLINSADGQINRKLDLMLNSKNDNYSTLQLVLIHMI